jgi:DmsE family decaheme c-type cytochrome
MRKIGPNSWFFCGLLVWLAAFASARAGGPAGAGRAAIGGKSAFAARTSQAAAQTPRPAQPTTPAPTSAPAAQSGYAPTGEKACLDCHDTDHVNVVLRTPHGVKGDSRTPLSQHQCETCHGASPEHIADPSARSTAVPFTGASKAPVATRNALCLTCHESGLRMNWQGSQHQRNDVACTTCHTIHASKDPVLVKSTQPARCFVCHADQRAQANRPSHHPIVEGKVTCADCHNPHGSPQDKMLVRARINDLCYKCHPDKRGPFLGEHAPVREDCMLCHTPHGSTQARLLRERPPYLCQQCHDTSHHSGSPYGGETYIGGRAPAVQVSGKGCLNCHSQIHGSNSPSGAYYLR